MAKANGRSVEGNKARALELAMSQIEKQYGKGSIMRLGDEGGVQEVEAISTGSLAVDAALGIGGLPKGRIVEIAGPEGAGKTMLSLHAIRESQKQNGTAAFIDAEHALDVSFARRIGVDVENLIISQPDSGEQALEIVDTLVRSGAFDIIVVDSVAALVPQAELEGDMGDSHMGLHARLMSQALRKLAGSINRSNTCLIFLNQLRMKIGVMFGNPETTTGGRALPFLFFGAHRHSPHRPRQRRRPRHWQSHPGQGSKKQSGPSLSRSRIRPDFSRRPDRHFLGGRFARYRR